MVPALMYLIVFKYLPMLGSVIAFQDFGLTRPIWKCAFVGFDNFEKLFNNPMFGKVVGNTVLISLYKLVLGFPAPILVALMLNEVRSNTYKRTLQTVMCALPVGAFAADNTLHIIGRNLGFAVDGDNVILKKIEEATGLDIEWELWPTDNYAQQCQLLIASGEWPDAMELAQVPVMMIPTSSATCAAYTPLSVIYTEKGACRGTWYLDLEINCVLADMDLLCAQPKRLMAAGIVDAMAKWVEIGHHEKELTMAGEDGQAARTLAKRIYDRFLADGEKILNGQAGPRSLGQS